MIFHGASTGCVTRAVQSEATWQCKCLLGHPIIPCHWRPPNCSSISAFTWAHSLCYWRDSHSSSHMPTAANSSCDSNRHSSSHMPSQFNMIVLIPFLLAIRLFGSAVLFSCIYWATHLQMGLAHALRLCRTIWLLCWHLAGTPLGGAMCHHGQFIFIMVWDWRCLSNIVIPFAHGIDALLCCHSCWRRILVILSSFFLIALL